MVNFYYYYINIASLIVEVGKTARYFVCLHSLVMDDDFLLPSFNKPFAPIYDNFQQEHEESISS